MSDEKRPARPQQPPAAMRASEARTRSVDLTPPFPIVQITSTATSRTGPLPTPEELEAYERIQPGLAERLVRMAEIPHEMAVAQQEHRHQLEQRVLISDMRARWAGLVVGAVLVLVVVGCGVWLAANGNSLVGLAAIITAVATLAGVFVYADRQRHHERAEKMRQVLAAPETD